MTCAYVNNLPKRKSLTDFDDLIKSLCVPKAKARPTLGGPATRQDFIPYIKRKVIASRVGDFPSLNGMDFLMD